MGSRIDPGFGLLLLEERFDADAEVVQGATSVQSSYTQSDPGPGQPVAGDAGSTWLPRVSGAQDVELEVIALRGGWPGRDATGRPAAAVAVRSDTTVETAYMGWDEPVTIRSWTAPPEGYSGTAAVDRCGGCVIPERALVVVFTSSSTSTDGQILRYDARAETWDTAVTFPGLTPNLPGCIVYDREGERLLLSTGYGLAGSSETLTFQSTDDGDTWSLYSRGMYNVETDAAHTRVTVAAPSRRSWSMFRAGSTDLHQFASSDRGVSWQEVELVGTVIGGDEGLVLELPTGLLVVYVANSTTYLRCRRLPTANTPFSDTSAILISTDATQTVAACVDADGVVYVFGTGANPNYNRIRCYRSLDEGLTWEPYTWDVSNDRTHTAYPLLQDALAVAGQVGLLHLIQGDASIPNCMGLLVLGGWTSVEAGVGRTLRAGERLERGGAGGYSGTAAPGMTSGRSWLPFDDPVTAGWTSTGAGGTLSFTGTPTGMRITTAAAVHGWEDTWTHGDFASGEAHVAVLAGGSSTSDAVSIEVVVSDGATSEYSAAIRLGTTGGIGVYDQVGASSTLVSGYTSIATTGVWLRWTLTATGFLSVWVRTAGQSTWTAIVDRLALTENVAPFYPTDQLSWGHLVNGTATSVWRMASHMPDVDFTSGIEDIGDLEDAIEDEGHLGLQFGRAIGGPGAVYPCPPASSSTTGTCPGLAATGGPARFSELTTLPVRYARGFDQVYPASSPSPRRAWLGTSTAEHRVVWDLGADQDGWIGDALGLVVLRSRVRQLTLEYWTGAAWTVAGTLDLSCSAGTALNCTRSGATLTVRAGSTAIARYFPEGTLVGGHAILSVGAGFVSRPILRQSGGYWDPASHQPMRLLLGDVDGTEDAAGTVDLIAPSGVLVVYPTAVQVRRVWRVKWAASQTAPESKYGAGVVAVGRVVGVGADPGQDWTRRLELRRDVSRNRDGTVRSVRELAPPGEVWSYGWTDGLMLRKLRSTTTPDYVAASGGLAIGSAEDAVSLLGVVEHALRSGEVPCVLLPRLPSATGTVLDPSLFRYGHLLSDSLGITGVAGTEGTDEVVRLDAPTFEEIR